MGFETRKECGLFSWIFYDTITTAVEQGYLNDIALGYGLDDRGFKSPQGL
jgi:hypothetical protein